MIRIDTRHINKKEIRNQHYQHLKGVFKEWLKKNKNKKGFSKVRSYFWNTKGELQEDRVKDVLIGDLDTLRDIIKQCDVIENKKTKMKDKPYTHFTGKPGQSSFGYSYLRKMKINVCPYCNMQYTFTIEEARRRPQFDHFFPKSKYAYLQASLYNLVPSCQSCNASKGEEVPGKDYSIYFPFDEEAGSDLYFQTKLKEDNGKVNFTHWLGFDGDFEVELVSNEDYKEGEKYLAGLKHFFSIQSLYKTHHNDYVVDIVKNLIIYDESRIKELESGFDGLFESEEEVLDTVFMNRIQKDDWGKRPLAKLTHDIYHEFTEN